jgi:hypothetical protein
MSELFRARWSEDIHRERITAVAEKASMDVTRLQRTRQFMDAAVPDAQVTRDQELVEALGRRCRQHGLLRRRRGDGDIVGARQRSRSVRGVVPPVRGLAYWRGRAFGRRASVAIRRMVSSSRLASTLRSELTSACIGSPHVRATSILRSVATCSR